MVADCHGGGGGGGGDFLIKLFGKTIPVPEPDSDDAKDLQQSSSSISSSSEQDHQDAHALDNTHQQDTSDMSPQAEVVDAEDPNKTSPPQTTHQKPGNGGGGHGDAARQREKLRKPDKVLPCPRCSSMDTKFCYFNNYNVNQPRHFCKNCQRYWTAGGAMRNVPVGAGRRKNKNAAAAAASHFFQRVRDALPAAYGGYGGGDALKATAANGGTVLSFGGHGGAGGAAPACLDLAEQRSGHLAPPPPVRNTPAPCSEASTNRDEHNKSSSVDETAAAANVDGSVPQQHPPTASMNVWPPPPYSCAPSPAAAYFSSGIAIPIYPAAPGYWGCMVPLGAWSLPWPVQQPPPSSSPPPTTSTGAGAADSSSDSHTLGKRPRGGRDGDDDDDDDGRSGGNAGHGNKLAKVWAPKTIRIDDVDEVARSSIWSLIGIKGDKTKQQQVDKPQLGMVFEPKREGEASKKAMMRTSSPSPFLHANPVALTRSVAFQEGS